MYFNLANETVNFIHDNYEEYASGELTLRDAAWYPVIQAWGVTHSNQEEYRQVVEYTLDQVVEILTKGGY